MTYRSTSAARAAWSSLIAPSRSTVSLRSAPLPGPAPAAKTTASAPLIALASSSAPARSRSQTTGSLPSAQVVDVSRIADHAADAVAPRDEQAGEPPGDLAVASDDDDVHAIQPQPANPPTGASGATAQISLRLANSSMPAAPSSARTPTA